MLLDPSKPLSSCPLVQGEAVHRDGERDGQRGQVSGRPQPKVSGQLPRLAPPLQPQPQNQRLPALPARYAPPTQPCTPRPPSRLHTCPSPVRLRPFVAVSLSLGFDSNCCNGVASTKSHSSSPHSHKPSPPGSGPALPTSDVSLNGSRSQQPVTRYPKTCSGGRDIVLQMTCKNIVLCVTISCKYI